jgi:hypothetical protein
VARSRAATQPPLLRFRGAPPGLDALAPAELFPEGPEAGTVVLKLGRVEQLAPVRATDIGAGASHLLVSLPTTTAPGSYEGRAKVGENEYPVVAEVEPMPSLQFSPATVRLQAASGKEEQAHVTVLNDGNVALEIAGAYAFGLFADEGVELAFATAFREDTERGERRFDRFVEGVAEQHGGFVRVRVSEGAGVVEPGDLRSLGLVFRFPDGLESGRSYGGALTIHGLSINIRATVAPASTPRAPRATARATTRATTRARRKAG